jgi:hypothetical protein
MVSAAAIAAGAARLVLNKSRRVKCFISISTQLRVTAA